MDALSLKALDRMRKLCSVREYCSPQIRTKLSSLGQDIDIEAVMTSLREDKYIDDIRFCSAFARDKSSIVGWGPEKIRFALRGKGIAESIINEALEEIDGTLAGERLAKLLGVKAKSLEGDAQIKQKLIRFALSRGYQYQQVKEVLDGILA